MNVDAVGVGLLHGGAVRVEPAVKHPAVFSTPILDCAADMIRYEWPELSTVGSKRATYVRVLDPFAGTGRVHELRDRVPFVTTTAVELEPEWAAVASLVPRNHTETFAGDARMLPASWRERFEVVFTSPCYGNRMADSHHAADACSACNGFGVVRVTLDGEKPFTRRPGPTADIPCSKCKGSGLSPRRSYTHDLGRPLSTGNAGAMQWGDEYRELHLEAWQEAHRVMKPGGLFILNVKDHVRDGERQHVDRWHRETCEKLGFVREWTYVVPLRGNQFGANREARVPNELVYVFRKAA